MLPFVGYFFVTVQSANASLSEFYSEDLHMIDGNIVDLILQVRRSPECNPDTDTVYNVSITNFEFPLNGFQNQQPFFLMMLNFNENVHNLNIFKLENIYFANVVANELEYPLYLWAYQHAEFYVKKHHVRKLHQFPTQHPQRV